MNKQWKGDGVYQSEIIREIAERDYRAQKYIDEKKTQKAIRFMKDIGWLILFTGIFILIIKLV
jgi:membrane protein DedA with SNARE-associated domain